MYPYRWLFSMKIMHALRNNNHRFLLFFNNTDAIQCYRTMACYKISSSGIGYETINVRKMIKDDQFFICFVSMPTMTADSVAGQNIELNRQIELNHTIELKVNGRR